MTCVVHTRILIRISKDQVARRCVRKQKEKNVVGDSRRDPSSLKSTIGTGTLLDVPVVTLDVLPQTLVIVSPERSEPVVVRPSLVAWVMWDQW